MKIMMLLCNRIGREAASSLFSVRNKLLACCFHTFDTVFDGLVLSFHELGKTNFSGIVVCESLLKV